MTAPATLAESPRAGRLPPAVWLERATVGCLFLLAFASPVSIAATQIAWMLALLFWVARFLFRPRPRLARTPADYALLGFFILSFVSALFSYEPDASIGKLRAASLFTIVYVVAENVWSPRLLRALAVTLVASCTMSTLYTFAVFAAGRGVKVLALAPDSPLRAAGVREGDTVLSVDGAAVSTPEDVERAVTNERPAADKTYRWTNAKVACAWDERAACVRVYRDENLPAFNVPRAAVARGTTAQERLGIARWSRGRDERATGFYGQYQTYSEVLQLVASLTLGLLVARGRRPGRAGLLCAAAFACMCGAMLLTLTRASWAGLLAGSLVVVLAGAGRRTVIVFAALALPLAVAGALVLREKRGVGFLDRGDLSTTWRLEVWREGFDILRSSPRHLLMGVGMDSLKYRWREWGMFEGGRLPWGHLHSTPLQVAFERGLPALAAWLALLYIYVRTAWRLARGAGGACAFERGLGLGALGGAAGFFVGGLVHYNLGDSEVAMAFYIIMGLTLAAYRLTAE